MSVALHSPLGLIAGNGTFPIEFARNAKARGISIIAVAHVGETDPALEREVTSCCWIKVGQLGTLIKTLKAAGVHQAAFAGGIKRVKLFGGVKPDLAALAMLSRLKSVKDDAILRGIAAEIERAGIHIIGAHELLPQSLSKEGLLTTRDFSNEEWSNAKIGWQAAETIGALDIGQSVVAAQGLVVAVEAVEGTDQAILRAGELTQQKGGVVVKRCKPAQDQRLDLPTIGPTTIDSMQRAGLTALLIEADRSIILDPHTTIASANRYRISIRAESSRTIGRPE